MRYRVFGTVEAAGVRGAEVHFVRRQDRVLWGLLLLEKRPITADGLCRLLWPISLPANPVRALQVGVSRIRRALSEAGATDAEVQAKDHCYQLVVPEEQVDVRRFHAAVQTARSRTDDPTAREQAARAALGLWRGEPLHNLLSDVVRDEVTGGLRELRIDAARVVLDLQLEAGDVEPGLVDLWSELHSAHPYRDDIAVAAALGMAARGRRVDALDLLRRHRRTVADDLGLDVACDLVELERSLLLPPASTTVPARPVDRGQRASR